jgi:hypothetical protein
MTNALRSVAVRTRPRLAKLVGTVTAVAVAAVIGAAVSPGGGGRTIAAVDPGQLGAGGEFHPIVPARIVDSRENQQVSGRVGVSRLADSQVIDIQLVGEGGLPEFSSTDGDRFDDDVLAVVVSVLVVDPTTRGYVRAFGTGTPEGETSVLNFLPGERVPNTAIIRPGIDGKMSLRFVAARDPGTTHVVVDVSGWYSTSGYHTNGARTVPIDPARLYDSREAQFGASPFGLGTQRELQIHGARRAGSSTVVVPDDPSITGVVLNVTGVNDLPGSVQTYVSLLQEPVSSPALVETSNLNLAPGWRRASLAIVPVPEDGTLTIFNRAGATHVIIDVVGYLQEGAAPDTVAGRVVPLVAPFRALDTREAEHFAQRLGPKRAEDWSFESFVNDVRIDGQTVGPQAGFLGNLTATALERQYSWNPTRTFLTAYPSPAVRPGGPPEVSNLNLGEGVSMPNLSLFRYGVNEGAPNQIAIYNNAGYVHYLIDVYAVVLADPA